MAEGSSAGQPAAYLESLLEFLACPLDNSAPLSVLRSAEGDAVVLKSRDAEYPIVHNVPCLIPWLEQDRRGDVPLWKAQQAKMWGEYQGGDEGVFTGDHNPIGRHVGEIIAAIGGGLYLDVGCGARPWPIYMAASSGCVRWIGVDPFLGDEARQFSFVQGLAEYLPFRRGVFDGALYASTIYHMLDPHRSLQRVHSVLKPGGKLFVWYTASRPGGRYLAWRGRRALGLAAMYSPDYQWAFTPRALHTVLRKAGFAVEEELLLCRSFDDWATCKHRSEHLMIAHRE